MERVILHSDLNSYYASVECLYSPGIRDKPVVVGGDAERRHGIVLAKNNHAKKYGIETAEPIVSAVRKCPHLVVMPPSFHRYNSISKKINNHIYYDYSNLIQGMGIDEAWIDLSRRGITIEDGERTAHEIRNRVKEETGLSVSIGVSFNMSFAKLASEVKKPDAVTVISKDNFKNVAWPLPVSDLLYVGTQTTKKMHSYGIRTIGALALTNPEFIRGHFGKVGIMLWQMANGLENAPVRDISFEEDSKSIGNSSTTARDIVSDNDIRITLYSLAESVACRLRNQKVVPSTIQVTIRDKNLYSFERQAKMPFQYADSNEIFKVAYKLVKKNLPSEPIRSLGIRATNLVKENIRQLSFLDDVAKIEKHEQAEAAIDSVRMRFGKESVRRAVMLTDTKLSNITHDTPHPVAYLKSSL